MSKKKHGLLREARKKINVKPKEIDDFIDAKGTSTKYYLEETFEKNKLFKYLLLLKINGISLDKLFSDFIKQKNLK